MLFRNAPTLRIFLATCVIVGGNALVVMFASHADHDFTVGDLYELYQQETYLILISGQAILLVSMAITYRYLTTNVKVGWSKFRALSFVVGNAIIGTQSVSLAKSVSAITKALTRSSTRSLQLKSWFTYVILIGWAFTMTFWVNRMNKALQLFEAAFIIPLLQVVWTMLSIVGGGIYFNEFSDFTLYQMNMFISGVCVVLFGIFLLAPKGMDLDGEEEDDDTIHQTWDVGMPDVTSSKYHVTYGTGAKKRDVSISADEDDQQSLMSKTFVVEDETEESDDMSSRLRHAGRQDITPHPEDEVLIKVDFWSSAFFFPVVDLTTLDDHRLAYEARQQQIASSKRTGVTRTVSQRSSPNKDRTKRPVRNPEIEMGYDRMSEGSLMERGREDKNNDGSLSSSKSLNS